VPDGNISRAEVDGVRTFRKLFVSLVMAALALPMFGSQVQAYTSSVYDPTFNHPQNGRCWCVLGVARTWLDYYYVGSTPYQSAIDNYITYDSGNNHHDKYDWTTLPAPYLKCKDGTYAHDSRGLAWAMYHWATSDQHIAFNDYTYGNQITANRSIMWNIRSTYGPVAVTVAAGAHEALIVDFSSGVDPYTNATTTINGFYIFDPWNGAGYGDINGEPDRFTWPDFGFTADTYISASSWNGSYFLQDSGEGGYYLNDYVIVAPKYWNSAPSDNPDPSVGEVEIGGASPHLDAPVYGTSPASDSLATAVQLGLAANELGNGEKLGLNLGGFTIGTTVPVDSLQPGANPYVLAELRVGDNPVAVALVEQTASGYRFGALRPLAPGGALPTADALLAGPGKAGLHAPAKVAWAWTDAGGGPFAPFAAVHDPSTGAMRYFAPGGGELNLWNPGRGHHNT
jgi:hypothetical protein